MWYSLSLRIRHHMLHVLICISMDTQDHLDCVSFLHPRSVSTKFYVILWALLCIPSWAVGTESISSSSYLDLIKKVMLFYTFKGCHCWLLLPFRLNFLDTASVIESQDKVMQNYQGKFKLGNKYTLLWSKATDNIVFSILCDWLSKVLWRYIYNMSLYFLALHGGLNLQSPWVTILTKTPLTY